MSIHFRIHWIVLLFLLNIIWNVSGKGVPPSYISQGKYEGSKDHFPLQFDIPSILQGPNIMSLGLTADPAPLFQAATANANSTTINLFNQATALGEGLNSNWETSDVSIEGGDATLDLVNDGFSSLGQWAQTLQETDFVQVEALGVGVDAVLPLESNHEEEKEEEKEVVVLAEVEGEEEIEHKDNTDQTIIQLPIVPVEVSMAPVQHPQPLNIEAIPSISIQNGSGVIANGEAVILHPQPPNVEAIPSISIENGPGITVNAEAVIVQPQPPPQVEVEAAPAPQEVPAPSPSTPVTMVEYVPLPEYGWHPTQSVGGSQNTGGSQVMSMNLQGNLVDVSGTQNVNVHVATFGTGSTSSVQLLGEAKPPGAIGLSNANKAPGGGGNEPNRVTLQLRAPPRGKPIVYQLGNYSDNHF